MATFHALTRRSVLVGGGALVLSAGAGAARRHSPRILFVCQYGTVKSPVAREWMRRRAAERGLKLRVMSRGLTPEEHMSPALATALEAEGINVRAEPLRPFAPADARNADIIVLFDKPPRGSGLTSALDWSDLGSMNNDYPAARADLLRRIDRLLDAIARR